MACSVDSSQTLDVLSLSDAHKEVTHTAHNHNNKDNTTPIPVSVAPSKKRKEKPPPPIPPSPETAADETLQTDLLLRKFELDAASETWQQNTIKKAEFKNNAHLAQQMQKFGLNVDKFQYQSIIKHTRTKPSELIEDGASIHVVTQFTDVGCPCVKNAQAKKGCWCIEEVKKQRKQKVAESISAGTIKPTAIHHFRVNPALNGNAAVISQKAQHLMHNLRTFGVQHSMPFASKAGTSAMDIVQNNIIQNARTQHYMPSIRMQQIRMQQMLLTARTSQNTVAKDNGASASVGSGGSVLGIRKHKDTIVFAASGSSVGDGKANQTGSNDEPPVKRRKKSRWSSK